MKVAVCIPSRSRWEPCFGLSLVEMALHTQRCAPGTELRCYNERGTQLANNRLALARRALADGCAAVLWLDDDQTFPADTLLRLLAHDLDIVGAIAPIRDGLGDVSSTPNCPDPLQRAAQAHFIASDSAQVRAVGAITFGCLLTRAGVLSALLPSCFEQPYLAGARSYQSEDTTFCRVARTRNFQIFADPHLSRELGHVATVVRHWQQETL